MLIKFCSLLYEQNLPVTRCRSCSVQIINPKSLLVTHCRSCLLHKITHSLLQNLLVTCCRNWQFQKVSGFSLQNSLDIHCKKSFFVKTITRWIILCLKSTKVGGSFTFFNIICFLSPRNATFLKSTYYPDICCYQNIF